MVRSSDHWIPLFAETIFIGVAPSKLSAALVFEARCGPAGMFADRASFASVVMGR